LTDFQFEVEDALTQMHITEASSTSVFFYLTLKFYQSQIILAVS
jgi:hypothetical protein